MKQILLLGSGGREHALAWKLKQSPQCGRLYIAPGNAGTASIGENVPIQVNDFEKIKEFCSQNKIDMLVVGPEEPLVMGLRDFLENDNAFLDLNIIGPGKSGARLEGSKDFSKAFMQRHNIPTAAYKSFTKNNFQEGVAYIKQHSLPVVLKADGLAAGKGVLICNTTKDALEVYDDMLQGNVFGAAGAAVVVEEFLTGIEMSLFVLTDGKDYVLLPEAKDYKKIGEGDTGLNTGGMGAVSPVPFYDVALQSYIEDTIVRPTLKGLQKEKIDYKGIIFIGLIVENGQAKVIEYNCRFGDPETEVVLPRLDNDLILLFEAAATGNLKDFKVQHAPVTTVGIVSVSGGYPGVIQKGVSIDSNYLNSDTAFVFHAGTAQQDDVLVTNGGRVFVSVGMASTMSDAKEAALQNLEKIQYEGQYFRKDIGYEF